jgi:thioesterase domain-containing protein
VLVDKTPSYALDVEVLRRAETSFSETRYIHLIRHPFAMIRSFEAARLEQVFFRHEHDFSRRELAELIWLASQENILQFLESVPAHRQLQVHFEQLVSEPERVLRGICEFLDLEYVESMAAPYQAKEKRMVDGIHPLSKMLGDVKFHEHKGVEAATADRWRQQVAPGERLAPETWSIAERLGYSRLEVEKSTSWTPLVQLQRGDGRPPLFFVHPVGGSVFCYAQLARHLGAEQTFYGLQSWGLGDGHSPLTDLSEMAARYLEAVCSVQPEGPYQLGGWSMGGLVAFEMAQQLRNRGENISLLALLDTHTPNVLGHAVELSDEELWLQFASDLGQLNGMEGASREPDRQSRLYQVFRANVRAMMGYEPKRYPGRITLFRANERLADVSVDPTEEWLKLAGDGVEVHVVPGDHYSILKEPSVLVTAEWLKVCLNINRVDPQITPMTLIAKK